MLQKQQTRKPSTALGSGERVIAVLNLLFGVPLALVLLVAFLREPIPRNSGGWLFGASMFLIAFGLNGAGICSLLRQHRLAQIFQWLPLIGVLGYAVLVGIVAWRNGLALVPWFVLAGTGFVFLATLTLTWLLRRFHED